MDGEKLPPFVIFKGANTPCYKIMKDFDSFGVTSGKNASIGTGASGAIYI
jgi:hypothetical protein